MLINYVPGEECRIAVVEDGRLEEFYQERASTESHVSNIYKGRVTNVEPAIQAAFVDFGLERNGFLHISDLHPKYFPGKDREEFEKVGHKTARHERPPMQKCLKRGQEVLVQVLKEGIGTKGPTLTSYLSIPGRFLVMMPDMQRLGVSRKVEDDEARRETRDILKALDPPKEFGFIVRTAGIGQTKTDLKRDLSYLQRLWKNIERKRQQKGKFGELYAESDLVIRTIRDVFNSDIDRIVCDDLTAARRARDFLAVANPRSKSKVVYYDDPVPLFHRMGVETQLDNMNAREVPLPSGGALVIDQTEALVAIDVNSGKSRAARDAETNAYKTNLEAVDEIARQLRLRDLGGLVVLDLIDMRPAKNRKSVESRFRNNVKKDRARTRIGPISQFGLLEMTRQRMRASLKKSIHQECKHCTGRGYTMSPESVVLSVMRRLALVMHRDDVARIELTISPDVAFHILNRKRGELVGLEKRYGKPVMVRVGGGTVDFVEITATNDRGVTLDTDAELFMKKLKGPSESSFRELNEKSLPELEKEVEAEAEALAEAAEAEAEEEDDFVAAVEDDAAEETQTTVDQAPDGEAEAEGDDKPKRRRRRRRGGRGRGKKPDDAESSDSENSDAVSNVNTADQDKADQESTEPSGEAEGDTVVAAEDDGARLHEYSTPAESDAAAPAQPPADVEDLTLDEKETAEESNSEEKGADAEDGPPKKKRRRRRSRRKKKPTDTEADTSTDQPATGDVEGGGDSETPSDSEADQPTGNSADDPEPTPSAKKTKRGRRRSKGKKSGVADAPSAPRLPLDEFGDVNGNVKLPEPGEPEADAPPPSDTPPRRPPPKPGRGYANRIINS
jgi:ribonuclease E